MIKLKPVKIFITDFHEIGIFSDSPKTACFARMANKLNGDGPITTPILSVQMSHIIKN